MADPAAAERPFALVTGASSGIGREVAVRLSATHRLVLHGRDPARLSATRAACEAPAEHRVWPHDLAATATIAPALEQLLGAQGLRIRSFVHCAGVFEPLPLRSATPEAVARTLSVNFGAALELTRLLAGKKLNGGELAGVVYVSSIASAAGVRGGSAYCASKGALDALMRALAVELAPRVRVNSVLPGAVRTPGTERLAADPERAERARARYPLGEGEPRDVALAVEFLLSDAARWITGHELVVDGGRTVDITD